jgi:hypothetical protein
MNLVERVKILDEISHTMAVISVDIDIHQSINNLSLNIVGENWFRDLFNFLDGTQYINLNFIEFNAPQIDLIDRTNRKILQVTSTGTKDKIDKTLTALIKPEFESFDVSMYYLKDKPALKPKSKREIFQEYGIQIDDHLFDKKDLYKKINDLGDLRLKELYDRFFSRIVEKYTDNMVLDFAIQHLLRNKHKVIRNYDDDIGSIETFEKLIINRINERIAMKINANLDYTALFLGTNFDSTKLSDLKQLVVDEFYRELLIESLKSKVSLSSIQLLSIQELHILAEKNQLDFNGIINNLQLRIEREIGITDFNSMEITWVIVSYFFEICDVGLKKNVSTDQDSTNT